MKRISIAFLSAAAMAFANWQLNGLFAIDKGFPISASAPFNNSLTGNGLDFADLVAGRVDAISTDDAILLGFAAEDPRFTVTGNPFHTEPYGVGLPKGDNRPRVAASCVPSAYPSATSTVFFASGKSWTQITRHRAHATKRSLRSLPKRINPMISTSYSVDGLSWSQDRSIGAGTTGNTRKRLVWLQQGHMRNWRIQRFRGDSQAHISFARLEAQLEPLAY